MVTLYVPLVSLRNVVLFHATLWLWSMIYGFPGDGGAYLYGELLLMVIGLWAIAQDENTTAVGIYGYWMIMTVLVDMTSWGVNIQKGQIDHGPSAYKFAFAMALISMLLKPLSVFYVYQEFLRRGGEFTFEVGVENEAPPSQHYSTVDDGSQHGGYSGYQADGISPYAAQPTSPYVSHQPHAAKQQQQPPQQQPQETNQQQQ